MSVVTLVLTRTPLQEFIWRGDKIQGKRQPLAAYRCGERWGKVICA